MSTRTRSYEAKLLVAKVEFAEAKALSYSYFEQTRSTRTTLKERDGFYMQTDDLGLLQTSIATICSSFLDASAKVCRKPIGVLALQ